MKLMTNEKAIEILKGLERTTGSANILKEPLQLAIKALEKQIAKAPVFAYNCIGINGEVSGCPVCPECKEPSYSLEWCAFCGQHLETEE